MSRVTAAYNDGFLAGYTKGKHETQQTMGKHDGDQALFALEEVQLVLHQETGYIRAGLGSAGLIWVRYKWTAGPLAGRYTFGSDPVLHVAFAQVCTRVQECTRGLRKASIDAPKGKYPPKG